LSILILRPPNRDVFKMRRDPALSSVPLPKNRIFLRNAD
jgi:hypothetical protein